MCTCQQDETIEGRRRWKCEILLSLSRFNDQTSLLSKAKHAPNCLMEPLTVAEGVAQVALGELLPEDDSIPPTLSPQRRLVLF